MCRIRRRPILSSMVVEFKKRLKKRAYYFIYNFIYIHKMTGLEVCRLQLLNAKKYALISIRLNERKTSIIV